MAATYLDQVLLSPLQFKGGPSNEMRLDDWASWFVANGASVARIATECYCLCFLALTWHRSGAVILQCLPSDQGAGTPVAPNTKNNQKLQSTGVYSRGWRRPVGR